MESNRPVPMPRRNVIITATKNDTQIIDTTPITTKEKEIKKLIKQKNSKEYENVELKIVDLIDNNNQKQVIINNNNNNINNINKLIDENNLKYKNIITELNIINNDKNINSNNDNNDNNQRPIPAPRKSNNNDSIPLPLRPNYINVEINKSTGAISKNKQQQQQHDEQQKKQQQQQQDLRKAPEIPERINNVRRHGVTSPSNYKNKINNNTNNISNYEMSLEVKPSLKKSYSASTISSNNSTEDSSSTENIPKFKTSTPSDILRSLGATSVLLTSSITERVAAKSKSAKHKFDKNLNKIGNWGTEQTNTASMKIKNVRKRLHSIGPNNFSLGRNEKKTNQTDNNVGQSRPQTLPANDELLKTISFNSPLNSKINNMTDLTVVESSYEIPKSKKVVPSPPSEENCPSYNDCIKKNNLSITDSDSSLSLSSASISFERNGILTQSMYSSIGDPPTQKQKLQYRIKSESNIYENTIVENNRLEFYQVDQVDKSSQDSLPCPIMPAPVLNPEVLYGKILPKNYPSSTESESPVRPTRQRKRKEKSPNYSNRATVDPNEFNSIDDIDSESQRFPRIFSRHIARDWNCDVKILPKGKLPIADRSDSWSFYDGTGVDETNSSPEPIYTNSEPLYGKLCETGFESNDCLMPESKRESNKLIPDKIKKDNSILIQPSTSRGLLMEQNIPKDLLDEFDPLTKLDINISDKSNKLILLEHLLSEDTYGLAAEESVIFSDDQSLTLSDIDDDDVDDDDSSSNSDILTNIPTPPERFDSLPSASSSSELSPRPSIVNPPKSMIIHQNMSLRSDSMDNLADESVVEPCLAQINDVIVIQDTPDLGYPEPSQTNWYIPETQERFLKNPKINPINRNINRPVEKIVKSVPQLPKPIENFYGDAPPSYFEATTECSSQSQRPSIIKPRTNPFNDKKPTEKPSTPPPQQKNSSMKSMFSNVLNRMEGMNLNLKRKNSMKTFTKNETKTVIEMIPKPILSQRYVHHDGHLIKFPSGVVEDILKEHHARNAVLRERKFQTFMDPLHKFPKEQFALEYITTIQCVDNHKFSNSPDMHCFELTISLPKNQSSTQALSNPNIIISATNSGNRKTQRICHVYGVAKRSERNIWMQKIIESITEVFPQKYTSEYRRAGWCYMKNSITSQWAGAWILLSDRKLLFQSAADAHLEIMDLRKARCIVHKESDESIKNLHVEKGPLLMIDCPPYTQYLIMNSPRETKVWRHIIKEAAHNNGTLLRKQQMTKDNVPVIVDKCINFIYTHGSMSEGIYRKSGSENAIQKLLTSFRTDAFSVQLTRSEYNEHDVANALKRFMRDLPEKLLEKCAHSFISVSKMTSQKEKIIAYKELLGRLPIYEYETLKKLIGHLNFIQSQKMRNKMGVSNLSIIWGITLMRQQKDEDANFYEADSKVVGDLITLYKNLYQLSADEITKEHIMLSVLQKYHAAAENLSDSVKQSGDLKVWITVDSNPENTTEEKRSFNVSLTPSKTVWDVCKELAPKINREPHTVTLNEIILDNDLQRPLHYTENVLDTVLRWTEWPDLDRKNNYLKLSPTKFLEQINRSLKNLGSIIPNAEVKFADNKTKNLRPFTLELNEEIISVMKKEKNNMIIKVKDIDLKKVFIYIGCEKKRELQDRWAITLIEHNFKKRNRDTPYIGHIMSGNNSNDQIVWYSYMMYSLYKNNILPNPEMIIP